MTRIFLRLARPIPAIAFLLGAACQTGTQAEVAVAPSPAATTPGQQHTPGMAHDATPSHPAPAPAGVMMQMDADTRFMHHMTAHHGQALKMVELVPARASSPGVKLLAERIDISQKDEMALMRRWLERRGKPLPDEGEHAAHMGAMVMPGMLTDAELASLAAATGSSFDRLFLQLMIKHHQGALTMVRELLGSQGAAQDSEMFRLVADIDADQRSEIGRMESMLAAMGARPPG